MARWIRWGATQLFFALSVLCSVTFAITSPSLLGSLGLAEAQLGELGGAYVTAYSVGLLLLGALMSTIATRLLLGGSALVAALGTLSLAYAHSFAGALLGMVLMGIGLSTAFVGVITAVGREFPRNFAFMAALSNAITNLCSALLAIGSAMVPILAGFRSPFRVLSLLLLATATLLVFVLQEPERPRGREAEPPQDRATLRASELPAAIGRILRTPPFWYVSLCFGGLFGSFLAFADLWNIPYQMRVFGHPIQQASLLNSAFPLGMVAGSLVGGTWARRAGFLRPVRGFALLTLGVEGLLYAEVLPAAGAGVAFFLVGFGSSASSLALAALPEHLEGALVPIATTLVMTLAYLLSALVQVLAGLPGGAGMPGGGAGITSFSAYRGSIGIVVVPVAIAAVSAFLLRARPPGLAIERRSGSGRGEP